ncbi:unnamed protein product [Closterium sp. Naga37s-1]|nr:unnamed protein product [Closterium sp. Naga37s-1]
MLYAVLPPASDPLPPLPSAHARDSSPANSARNSRGAAAVDGAAHERKGAHARAKSWDVGAGAEGGGEGGRAADAGGGAAAPRLVPAMMTSLSLTVECLMTTASVSIQGTWEVGEYGGGRGQGGGGGGGGDAGGNGGGDGGGDGGGKGEEQQRQQCCDCLFVLPTSHRASVTAVEVTLADGRFLATAVLPADEAEAACRASQERAAAAHSAAQPVPPRPARPSFLRLSSASFSRSGSSRHRWKSQEGVEDGDGRAEASREGEWGKSSGKEGGVSGGMERGEGGGESGEGGESGRRRGGNGDEDEEEEEVEGSAGQRQRCVARRHAAVLLDESPVHTPHMLRLRIPKVPQGSSVRVRATYVEAMAGRQGYSSSVRVRVTYVEVMAGRQGYSEMSVPLTVPLECVPGDLAVQDVVRVSCTINSGLQCPMKIGDFNHPMKVVFVDLGRATFVGHQSDDDPDAWPNADFTISFQVVTEDVSAAVLVQAPLIGDPDPRASFALSIAPPDPAQFSVFSRAVVFILDSECGLRGRPMEDARRAVAGALKRLKPHDSFAVVAFEFELLLLDDELEAASPEAVRRACKFVLQAHDWPQPVNVLTPLQLVGGERPTQLSSSHNPSLASYSAPASHPHPIHTPSTSHPFPIAYPIHNPFHTPCHTPSPTLRMCAPSPPGVQDAEGPHGSAAADCTYHRKALHFAPHSTTHHQAFRMLRGHTAALQQVVLITDGPVRAERRACHWVQRALADWGGTAPRISTFGIGPSVNPFFLKWLAAATHGSSQVTRNPAEVRRRLDGMLQAMARPIVTNIAIRDLPPACELYPYPIPDLYASGPVVVSGRMGDEGPAAGGAEGGGGLPLHVELRGVLASGAPWKFRAALSDAGNLPLSSVGAGERVAILTADAWLHSDPHLHQAACAMSVGASVVSEHTRMLLLDTTRSLLDQLHTDQLQGHVRPLHHYVRSPTAPVTMVPGLTAGFGSTQSRPASTKPNGEVRSQQRQHRRMGSCVSSGEWEYDGCEEEDSHNRLLVSPSLSQSILGSVLACYRPKFR